MNRIEIAAFIIFVVVGMVLIIRSKWFDGVIDWAFRKPTKTKSETKTDGN